YYRYLVSAFDELVLRLLLRKLPASGASTAELAAMVDIGVAGIFQMALCFGLARLLRIDLQDVLVAGFSPLRGTLGFGLGLAQAGASMFASMVAFAILQACGAIGIALSGTSPSMVRSGWVGSFVRLRRSQFGLIATLMTVGYVVTEEILFRG